MKKNRKLLLFTVSLLFSFFGFINKVSAITSCYYALPFSSYDYVNDKQYDFGISETDYDSEIDFTTVVTNVNYSVNRFSKPLSSSGLMTLEIDNDKKKFYFTPWLKDETTFNSKFVDSQDLNVFNGKCPKYISIGGNANLEEATKNDYSKFLKSQTYLDLLNSRTEYGSLFDKIIEKVQAGNKVIMPIYYDIHMGSQNYNYEAVKIYNDIYTQKWKTKLEQAMSDMKSACGNDWLEYTNVSSDNYESLHGKQGEFIKYSIYSDDHNLGIDANASRACKGQRTLYLRTWLSFYDYWTTMASGYNEPIDKKLCFSVATDTGSFPKQCIYMADIFSRYTSFFNEATDAYNYMVNSGTKRVQDHVDLQAQKISKNEEEIKKINYYLNILNTDLCSGLCSTTIHESNLKNSTDFDNCIANKKNTHDTCYTKLDSCKNDMCGSCKSMPGTAQTACYSSCTSGLTQCMEKAGYEVALDNRRTKIGSLEEAKRQLQNEIDNIKASKTYVYSDDPLAQIEWRRAKYTPKCTDIKVITYLWSIVKYLAPFLLMIFTGFDYLKVVMAADEAAMKKIKKSIPKRLIAFILLLVMPLLLKIFMENFGTGGSNKLGYLKCILTGDTTSGAEDTGSGSESSDGNSENSESNEDDNSNSNINANSSSTSSTNTSTNTNTNNSSSNTKKESSNKNNNTLNSAIEGIKSGVQESLDNSKNSNSVNNDEDQSDFYPEFSTTGR